MSIKDIYILKNKKRKKTKRREQSREKKVRDKRGLHIKLEGTRIYAENIRVSHDEKRLT